MKTIPLTTVLSGTRKMHLSLFNLKEKVIESVWLICALFSVLTVIFILLFLFKDSYPGFVQIGILSFLTGMTWNPVAAIPSYGIAPLIVGTLLVTLGSMVIAVPLSIGAAVYISELASPRVNPAGEAGHQAGHRTAGRHSIRGIWVLRSDGDD